MSQIGRALTLASRKQAFDLSLYLVANRPSFRSDDSFFSKISQCLEGGVSCIQLRDHTSDFKTAVKTATHLKKMMEGTNASFMLNTNHLIEVAATVLPDGVYLEENISPSEVRKRLGENPIIGVPVQTMDEVLAAEQNREIDYLSVKVGASKNTSQNNYLLWGFQGLEQVRTISTHRIVAIGGLNIDTAPFAYKRLRPHDGIAMAGGLMDEKNPKEVAQKIQEIKRLQGISHG
jgi:thiamine-phosphate pyrophosphorylase